ncbi:uncharacterized protein N7484_002980 [Penicillium longicatenatum]|uniref:uncharacterized protein n=1 Tax=Penicillium longicatenatum TaxID=1561947 RepID=UPI0025498286|nr:uncharacterized protein N7484_002980 [Penicillium longicatenatum]KAJ5649257.1 hypothetical protein N7484_002980 [Penicillium longicatenatum]
MALRATNWDRIYIHKTNGRKNENGRPVMSSVLNCAERLFGGFEETVSITIVEDDRSEIFNVREYISIGWSWQQWLI